jgi:hypothetical protein
MIHAAAAEPNVPLVEVTKQAGLRPVAIDHTAHQITAH